MDESGVSEVSGSRLRDGIRRWTIGCAMGITVAGLAACGSGSSSPPSTVHAHPPASVVSPTTTTTAGSGSDQAAVLNAWRSGEQTLYGYLQSPWQQDRANLVAGETAATLWPNLAAYFADPALKSEQTFLVGVKMAQLNGPTSFDLGTPKVSALTSTTATVTGCIYDTGTTTAAGTPGPTSLGGGAGSYSGDWTLRLTDGSWRIASYQTATVPKC